MTLLAHVAGVPVEELALTAAGAGTALLVARTWVSSAPAGAPGRAGVTTATLDRVFSAVSDPTRRAILARLADSDARVTDLAATSRSPSTRPRSTSGCSRALVWCAAMSAGASTS